MYGSSGTNSFGYGRNPLPSSSKNQQNGKYSGAANTSGYSGLGQGNSSGYGTFGSSSNKVGARTRDSQNYVKPSQVGGSSVTGGVGQQKKSIQDRTQNTTTGKPTSMSKSGYTPNSSIGLQNGRSQNGSSALASSATPLYGSQTQGGSYAQTSNMLSQSYKQKSTLGQQNGSGNNISYGAYGIAINNKISNSGWQIVGQEQERVVSRGQNGRSIIGRQDKVEESKRSSVTASSSIRTTKNYQQYAFGDNYGNTREFQKPDVDDSKYGSDNSTLLRKGQSQHQDMKNYYGAQSLEQEFLENRSSQSASSKSSKTRGDTCQVFSQIDENHSIAAKNNRFSGIKFEEVKQMWSGIDCLVIKDIMKIVEQHEGLKVVNEQDQPQDDKDKDCPRLVACGKTGTGKSSILNSFLLGYQDDETEELFQTSASINACTYLTVTKKGKLLGCEGDLQVIDTPGLQEGEKSDSEHILNMIRHLRTDTKYVNLFLLTVNGQEPRFDSGTRLLIKTFEQSFGEGFWDHFAVVYTRWGSSAQDKARRKKGKLTEEGRTGEVLAMINSEYPNSKGKTIGVYFTDTFEIDEGKTDPTSHVFRQIWTVAAAKSQFMCSNISAVKCVKWQEEYNKTLKLYKSMLGQIGAEGNFRKRYMETFEFLINIDVSIQKELSQDNFTKLKDLMHKVFQILTEEQKQESERKRKEAQKKHQREIEAQRAAAEKQRQEAKRRQREDQLKFEREMAEAERKRKEQEARARREREQAEEREREIRRKLKEAESKPPQVVYQSTSSFGGFGGFSSGPPFGGFGGFSSGPSQSSSGPRCNDGTLDMRFSCNKGLDKYS